MSCDCPIAKLKFSFFQAIYVVDYNDYFIDLRHCYPCCVMLMSLLTRIIQYL